MGIRAHLRKTHPSEYLAGCKQIGYQVLLDTQNNETEVCEEITKEGVTRYLAKVIAELDLVSFSS